MWIAAVRKPIEPDRIFLLTISSLSTALQRADAACTKFRTRLARYKKYANATPHVLKPSDLKRPELNDEDHCIFPGLYAPVLVMT